MHSKITANDFRARMPRDPTGQGLRDSVRGLDGQLSKPKITHAIYPGLLMKKNLFRKTSIELCVLTTPKDTDNTVTARTS